MLASSSDDSTIKLWVIDDGEHGITEHLTDVALDFDEHAKKCKAIQWHHIAENVLSSYGEDNTVRIWDVNAGECNITFADLDEPCTAMRWSPNGKLLGVMVRKNTMAFFDPRVNDSCIRAASHQGPRAQKLAWIDDDTFFTSGFNPSACREYAVWDMRSLD